MWKWSYWRVIWSDSASLWLPCYISRKAKQRARVVVVNGKIIKPTSIKLSWLNINNSHLCIIMSHITHDVWNSHWWRRISPYHQTTYILVTQSINKAMLISPNTCLCVWRYQLICNIDHESSRALMLFVLISTINSQ